MMGIPWTDWQFWVVSLVALWGVWAIVRSVLPRSGQSSEGTCSHCETGEGDHEPAQPRLVALGRTDVHRDS